MAKKQNSINVKIFMALKVSEISKVPVLLMSNPGVGKTSSVYMYAKLRNMDVIVLRGNSESPEAIHGYETVSTAPVEPGKPVLSSHTRPSWMNRILENYKNGKKTILFLDELTTANEYVQAALLQLIFDRKCGVEELPPVEDCLIVSAGNYMNNLTTSMTVISPILNRFMIFNITPSPDDIGDFLCKYNGALSTGKVIDPMINLEKQLKELDEQEAKLNFNEENLNKIGEYFEKSICETTRLLWTSGKKIDLSITNLKDLYGDVDDDDPNLYGFPSFRTLNYLREISVSCYKAFGKFGIQSENFRAMIDGLCGMGLTKEVKGSQIIINKHKIGADFHESLSKTAIELDKLSSTKLPEYIEYFKNLLDTANAKGRPAKTKGRFGIPELQAIKNKISELANDAEMKNIEKPLDKELLNGLCKCINKTNNIPVLNYNPEDQDIKESLQKSGITPEVIAGCVTQWNTVAETYNAIHKFVHNSQWNYPSSVKTDVNNAKEQIKQDCFKLKSYIKILKEQQAGSSSLIPELTNLV